MQVSLSDVDSTRINYKSKNRVSFGKASYDYLKYMPKKDQDNAKILDKLRELRGDAGSIIVTSLGTGIVAPLMIAYNPFVKAPKNATPEEKEEVEKNKKYSAWRQPLSAVLAIVFQLGAHPFVNRYLEYQTNNPNASKSLWQILDKSIMQDEKYIIRTLKKEPHKKSVILNDALKTGAITVTDVANMSEKDLNKKLAEVITSKQKDVLVKNMVEKGQIIFTNRPDGKNTVGNKRIAQIINNILNNNISKLERLKINDTGIEYYKNRGKMLIDNEALIKQIFGAQEITNEKASLTSVVDFLKVQKGIHKDNEAVVKLIDEVLDLEKLKMIKSRCSRTIDRIDYLKGILPNFTPEAYEEFMKKQNEIVDGKIKEFNNLKFNKLDDPKVEINSDQIKAAISKIADASTLDPNNTNAKRLFGGLDVLWLKDDGKGNDILSKIGEKIIDGYKKCAKNHYTGVNQFVKIIVTSIIMLPISCTVLNYVYPIFMETFFPDLAGVKKGGK